MYLEGREEPWDSLMPALASDVSIRETCLYLVPNLLQHLVTTDSRSGRQGTAENTSSSPEENEFGLTIGKDLVRIEDAVGVADVLDRLHYSDDFRG